MTRTRAVVFRALRRARDRLDALAVKHPELLGPGGDGVRGWATTLEREEVMADTEQVAFRLPKVLIERLDAYAARLAKEQAGMNVTRTDAVRVLLVRALDAVGSSPTKPKSRASTSKKK